MVVRSKGFAYTAERPEAPSFAEQKWGWSAARPGGLGKQMLLVQRRHEPPGAPCCVPHAACPKGAEPHYHGPVYKVDCLLQGWLHRRLGQRGGLAKAQDGINDSSHTAEDKHPARATKSRSQVG